ncbi:hypothetical protein [Sphaerimonospora thailandensis]|uniref:Uncharacterized protein n=1 Tax=Sphaerimonospora thailandensis TaxID=795644 RepID=A0A8J3R770_9ACTN|nr:hypothetical protein [Sphaerimonospora thailandensis]GIH70372.1 hypothetical protein Mth01_26250 [Sphaerimonospora thailandensis]
MTNDRAAEPPRKIPEFHAVHRDLDTGLWSAIHTRSRRAVEATTFDGLEQRACAVRIAESWRDPAQQPALRDLTDPDQVRANLRETAERARQVLHLISRRWREEQARPAE